MMIYTSNKKYPFYISCTYGFPEACSMAQKAQEQHVHRNGISDRDKRNKY
jgi:hypothetical protein